MMQDVLLTADGGFVIKNGDMVVDDATGQHQHLLLLAEKGTIRQYGDCGVGAASYLLDHNRNELLWEISKEFSRDGMTVRSVSFSEAGEIVTDADYESTP